MQNVLFHDDFDVLAASGAFGAGMDSVLGKLGVAPKKKKKSSDKAKSGQMNSSDARKKVLGIDGTKSEIKKKKKKLKGMGLAVGTKMKCVKDMKKGAKGE